MKPTDILRKADKLGRVVIPIESISVNVINSIMFIHNCLEVCPLTTLTRFGGRYKLKNGWMYLFIVMDWHFLYVVGRSSSTMDISFVIRLSGA